jgi:hypothetical protein
MSGASWPAKKADESGRARFIQFLGNAFSALPCPRFAPRRAIPRRTVGHRRACVPACARPGIERITEPSHRRAYLHLPLRWAVAMRPSVAPRPRVAARSSMRGASLPATVEARRRRTRNAHPAPSGSVAPPTATSAERDPVIWHGCWFTAVGFARLELELIRSYQILLEPHFPKPIRTT